MVYRLRDDVQLEVVYADETRFGSVLSGRIDTTVRIACEAIIEARHRGGMKAVMEDFPRLVESATARLAELYEAPGVLRPECLYPDPRLVRPASLSIYGDALRCTLELEPSVAAELATWVGRWQSGSAAPEAGPARRLWDGLRAAGALTRSDPRPRPSLPTVTLVGHAAVAFSRGTERLIIDPYLLPRSASYPTGYQPMGPELAPTAVLITHSHPDHFDPGTLLRWGPDVPIVVPSVPRESILSIDMAARLRELGFRNVRCVGPDQTFTLGSFEIQTLPLLGEQPAEAERWHPEVRNIGNLYIVEVAGQRWAAVADAGRDREGDVRALGPRVRALGSLDGVFGGYRGWVLYPVQFLFSSVARYLLFVAPECWGHRQSIMDSADELIDVAERWGAGVVVPYADGGAPWYWQRGLGPDLSQGVHNPHFDPEPEAVLRAAAGRTTVGQETIASTVRVRILRPGQGIDDARATVVEPPGHRWSCLALPRFEQPSAVETRAVSLKKVLLRHLARHEAERLGLSVTPEEVKASIRSFKREFGMQQPQHLRAWLAESGLDDHVFVEISSEMVLLDKVLEHHEPQLVGRVHPQQALMTAWQWKHAHAEAD